MAEYSSDATDEVARYEYFIIIEDVGERVPREDFVSGRRMGGEGVWSPLQPFISSIQAILKH